MDVTLTGIKTLGQNAFESNENEVVTLYSPKVQNWSLQLDAV